MKLIFCSVLLFAAASLTVAQAPLPAPAPGLFGGLLPHQGLFGNPEHTPFGFLQAPIGHPKFPMPFDLFGGHKGSQVFPPFGLFQAHALGEGNLGGKSSTATSETVVSTASQTSGSATPASGSAASTATAAASTSSATAKAA